MDPFTLGALIFGGIQLISNLVQANQANQMNQRAVQQREDIQRAIMDYIAGSNIDKNNPIIRDVMSGAVAPSIGQMATNAANELAARGIGPSSIVADKAAQQFASVAPQYYASLLNTALSAALNQRGQNLSALSGVPMLPFAVAQPSDMSWLGALLASGAFGQRASASVPAGGAPYYNMLPQTSGKLTA